MIRLVLFDIDGTLIQSGGAGEKAFGRVCDAVFGVPNGTVGLRFAGRTDTGIVREFFARHAIAPTPENFRRFFDSYVFWLDHLLGQLHGRVLPRVNELLDELQELPHRPLVGLLTGNIRLGAEIKLSHYGLWKRFRLGGFADDDESRNRIAAVARDRGSQMLGRRLRGEEIMVIGDTPLDIECARAIEAQVLAVATGSFPRAELEAHRPTWALDSLAQISARELCGV